MPPVESTPGRTMLGGPEPDRPGGHRACARPSPLLNAGSVSRGALHDVDDPIPVKVTLRWETGDEELDTVAVEWWGSGPDAVVRVRIADLRVMTGAVWLPAADVRRRGVSGGGA